jgi:ABC-2 type transport system permease protein
MAVYERAYRGYAGPLTPTWSRFLILPRYIFGDVFGYRLFAAFFTACFIAPLIFAVTIYLHHNASALLQLDIPASAVMPISAKFFEVLMAIQGSLAFVMALVVGPSLVAPDLANNGLALYLSRPFSRTEYVIGKMSVLAILLSLITWIPGIVLFALQAGLEGLGWAWTNIDLAGAMLLGSWIWITVLALMTLAASAWVKRKPLAGALVLGSFFVSRALAAAINATLRTEFGWRIDLGGLMTTVWARLFGVEPPTHLSLGGALFSLTLFSLFCVWLLRRKVRAYEVVRG